MNSKLQEEKEKNDNLLFGQKIKEIRVESGLTQGEVASKLNVTPGFISNIENGRTAMSMRLLIYYATITGRSLDSLVGLLDSDYADKALDNDIIREVHKLDDEQKKKLLDILKIVNKK